MKRFLYLFSMVLISFSCIRHDYDLEDLSLHTELEMGYAFPVVKGEFNMKDLAMIQEGGLLEVQGDTILLHKTIYPVYSITREDMLRFPDQNTPMQEFHYEKDIYFDGNDTIIPKENPWLAKRDLVAKTNMEIDSMFLNNGFLYFTVYNNYFHRLKLNVKSTSLIDTKGNPYSHEVIFDAGKRQSWSLQLNQYKIIPEHSANDTSTLVFEIQPTFYKLNDTFISKDQSVHFFIEANDLNDLNRAFGNATQKQFAFTVPLNWFSDSLYRDFLSGRLAIDDPRIGFFYNHSLGCESDLHFRFESYLKNGDSIFVTPPNRLVAFSNDFMNPSSMGDWIINKSNAEGIDKVITFFDLDSLYVNLSITTNPNKERNRAQNYLLDSSRFDLGLNLEVPLKLLADVHFTDTILNPLRGSEVNQQFTLDHFRIHYSFENGFPLGFDASIELYDSIQQKVVEKIPFNENNGLPFLQPAEVSDGNVIGWISTKGSIAIKENSVNNFLNMATHLIVKADFFTSNQNYCQIGISNGIRFKLGFDLKGEYTLDPKF